MKTGMHRERANSSEHESSLIQTPAQLSQGSQTFNPIVESEPVNLRPVKIGVTLMLVAFLAWSLTQIPFGLPDSAPAPERTAESEAPPAETAPAQERAAAPGAPAANAAAASAQEEVATSEAAPKTAAASAQEEAVTSEAAPNVAAAPAQRGEARAVAPAAGTPGAPALTAVTAAGAVHLSWTAVPGVDRYALFTWWDKDTGWQKIGGYSLTGTSHRHTGLVADTTYHYQVRAVFASGEAGPWSQLVSTTPLAAPSGSAMAVRSTVVELKSLHTAVRNGDTELVQTLLDAGADPNFIDTGQDYDQTPLSLAIGAQEVSMLRILIAAGADPNVAVNPAFGVGSHLTYAMSLGNTELVRILLDAGADPNIIDDPVQTVQSDGNRIGDRDGGEGGVVEALVCLFSFFFACP